MRKIDDRILISLTHSSLENGERVKEIRKMKHYFGTHYVPEYFVSNFKDCSIDELSEACLRLKNQGYIEYSPLVYLELKMEGAVYCEENSLL